MNVLITGANGQVGRALQRTAPPGTRLTACTRQALDIARPEAVETVRAHSPDVIVNAAAYTAVDQAESDYGSIKLLNPRGLIVRSIPQRPAFSQQN